MARAAFWLFPEVGWLELSPPKRPRKISEFDPYKKGLCFIGNVIFQPIIFRRHSLVFREVNEGSFLRQIGIHQLDSPIWVTLRYLPGNSANVAFFGIVKTWPEISGLLLTFNFFGDQAGSRIETPANISPLNGMITPNKNPLFLGVYGGFILGYHLKGINIFPVIILPFEYFLDSESPFVQPSWPFIGGNLQKIARWWFQKFVIFITTWGRFPFWLIFFKGVETTNQIVFKLEWGPWFLNVSMYQRMVIFGGLGWLFWDSNRGTPKKQSLT